MIKIVDESQEAVKKAVCRNCSAVLEYTRSDVKARHGRDYSGGPAGREWINCPRCLGEVVLRAW